jgi:hypothetical protein
MSKWKNVLEFRPTQFAIGMDEIIIKVKELKKLESKGKLDKYLAKNPLPVVRSPFNHLYLTDHHHLLFACWHANIKKVKYEIIEDYGYQDIAHRKFWQRMQKKNWAYLYDQFGDGPRSAIYLPRDIRGLADDPYRSLAWFVRKAGGYENSDECFAEFKWADFFRKRRLLDQARREDVEKYAKKAIHLARLPDAKNLPGYITPKKAKAAKTNRPAKKKKK